MNQKEKVKPIILSLMIVVVILGAGWYYMEESKEELSAEPGEEIVEEESKKYEVSERSKEYEDENLGDYTSRRDCTEAGFYWNDVWENCYPYHPDELNNQEDCEEYEEFGYVWLEEEAGCFVEPSRETVEDRQEVADEVHELVSQYSKNELSQPELVENAEAVAGIEEATIEDQFLQVTYEEGGMANWIINSQAEMEGCEQE